MKAVRMKVATWNINGIARRLDLLLEWLAESSPDVVALQELKSTDEAFPRERLEAAGYGSLCVGERTWNGVALLAKGSRPVEVRRSLPGDPTDRQSRYLEAAIDGVLFASLYLPNGNPQPGPKFAYKLAWFERLIAHAQTLMDADVPVALLGDFNVVPTELDIYRTTSYRDNALVQPESREAFRRLMQQGWTDALRATHPDEAIYTFWDYMRQRWPRDAGLRIDHVLLGKRLAPKLVDAGVDRDVRGRDGASDHAPMWVQLRNGARQRAASR
jgi:exodeoxyribonuclease-3